MYYCITLLHNPARGGPPAPKSLIFSNLDHYHPKMSSHIIIKTGSQGKKRSMSQFMILLT